jgi:hypothetical protein
LQGVFLTTEYSFSFGRGVEGRSGELGTCSISFSDVVALALPLLVILSVSKPISVTAFELRSRAISLATRGLLAPGFLGMVSGWS